MNQPEHVKTTNQTQGIVRGGETLKAHRDRIMADTRQSRHYAGLETLELRDKHPILYNKLFSRLRAGVVATHQVAVPVHRQHA